MSKKEIAMIELRLYIDSFIYEGFSIFRDYNETVLLTAEDYMKYFEDTLSKKDKLCEEDVKNFWKEPILLTESPKQYGYVKVRLLTKEDFKESLRDYMHTLNYGEYLINEVACRVTERHEDLLHTEVKGDIRKALGESFIKTATVSDILCEVSSKDNKKESKESCMEELEDKEESKELDKEELEETEESVNNNNKDSIVAELEEKLDIIQTKLDTLNIIEKYNNLLKEQYKSTIEMIKLAEEQGADNKVIGFIEEYVKLLKEQEIHERKLWYLIKIM